MAVPLKVEMRMSNAWVDITADVRVEPPLEINHGIARETGVSDPSSCTLFVNNTAGKYSPRNPVGPYYGLIGRNTPLRVGITRSTGWLESYCDPTMGSVAVGASCPDTAALSFAGDVDLRIETLADPSVRLIKANAYELGYTVSSASAGSLYLRWSTSGTAMTNTVISTKPLPYRDGRVAFRATLDVNNGAGGHDVSFYYSDAITGTWTLIETITTAGTTSIGNSTGTLSAIVVYTEGGTRTARITKASVMEGIGGTVRANPDFTAQSEGASSFSDGVNTWTITPPARITKIESRFAGQVSEFPPKWDTSGRVVWSPLTAAGATRRMGQGDQDFSILRDAVTKEMKRSAGVITGYWPMEDGPAATSFGSAYPGGSAMTWGAVAPELAGITPETTVAQSASVRPASITDPIARMTGVQATGVPGAIAGTAFTFGFLLSIPETGATDDVELARFTNTGTAATWIVYWRSAAGGQMKLRVINSLGAEVLNVNGANLAAGTTSWCYVQASNSGANVSYDLTIQGGSFMAGTIAAVQVGSITAVDLGLGGAITGDVGIGHVVTASTSNGLFNSDFIASLIAYNGELVQNRFHRRGTLAGFSTQFANGVRRQPGEMGEEGPGRTLDVLRASEAADLSGILSDSVENHDGLRFINHIALFSEMHVIFPVVELDYAAAQITPPLDPTDDDRYLRNDVTVTVPAGSSARAAITTGPLNSSPYPTGVGLYDDERELRLATDALLPHAASWLLSFGTTDETRFPQIAVDLIKNPTLDDGVSKLRPGSWVRLKNLPAWLPPDPVELLVLGWRELIGYNERTITLNCAPASPVNVWQIESQTYGRLDSFTTTTNEALDTTETGVDFTGDTWITTAGRPGDFPFDILIGGERMTVTANANATAGPFTVTRSVNGVVKTHASGAPIRLYRPVHYAY